MRLWNLFKASFRFIWSQAIQAWYDEIKNFKYGVGKTKEDAVVGHFTQVVWSNSSQLGCAMSDCGTFFLGVCHYYPAVYPFPSNPYFFGPTCDYCPNNCDDRLCTIATCPYGDTYVHCELLVQLHGCEEEYVNDNCQGLCRCPGKYN